MGRLDGKVAVITQAGSSFGRVLAHAYAREGAILFLQDWEERRAQLEANAASITSEGGQVFAGVYDIVTGIETARMTADVMEKFGRVDVLVNTAMQGGHGIIFDITEDKWDLCIDRGLKSYFLTCQHLGEQMARVGYGKIINLTSIIADLGSGGAVPWGACRGGVNALTFAVAQGLGEYGIRCVALARGPVQSTAYTEEALKERQVRIPFGRLGKEDDLIGPAVFLATSDSDWVNGSVLYCEGGYAHAAANDAVTRATEVPLKRKGKMMDAPTSEVIWLDKESY